MCNIEVFKKDNVQGQGLPKVKGHAIRSHLKDPALRVILCNINKTDSQINPVE